MHSQTSGSRHCNARTLKIFYVLVCVVSKCTPVNVTKVHPYANLMRPPSPLFLEGDSPGVWSSVGHTGSGDLSTAGGFRALSLALRCAGLMIV